MRIVKCKCCGYLASDKDLARHHALLLPENLGGMVSCPICGGFDVLTDVNLTDSNHCVLITSDLANLWEAFSEMSVDSNDRILEDFAGFPEGTNRFEILRWFHSAGYLPILRRS